jgi:MFS family permease
MTPAKDAVAPDPIDETSPRYRGWRVVLACFLMALFLFGFGLYGQGVYLAELQGLNGWPAALISGASTLSLVLCNILATFTSDLVTRLGIRRLVLAGLLALAASVILLAFATSTWQLYAAFALMAFGWIGMGTVVIATVMSLWFVHRRGFAISLAFTGASFGGVVVTPLLVFLVERIGFRAAMSTMAALMVAVLLPVIIAWIGPPSAGVEAEGPPPQLARAPGAVSRGQLIILI